MNEIQGKRILIVGYSREGQSTERFLHSLYPTISVDHTDQKDGKDYLKNINTYDTVVRSPGVPIRVQELAEYRRNGGWVTSATNIFFSLCPGMTIGVTGTKGKSTTASLIAHMLSAETYRGSPFARSANVRASHSPLSSGAKAVSDRENARRAVSSVGFHDVRLVGNIGLPMLDFLEGATKDTVFVIELSSHQLEDIHYSPHIAVILGIVPEHMDYYPNFETYVAAKGNIVKYQNGRSVVVFNPKDPIVSGLARKSKGKKVPFVHASISATLLHGNKQNIAAAVAVAKLFDISEEKIRKAIKTFQPLPHRLELVGIYKGITFYNDSLATIPEATIHALEALGPEVETLIAGGFDRGLDYSKLGKYLANSSVKTLILFPDTGKKIQKAIQAYHVSHITCHVVTMMEEAVKLAYKHTDQGKICLLSPASASFNLFKNYEDRGDQFREWVKKLAK